MCCHFFCLAITDYQKIIVTEESMGYGKVIMQMMMSKALHLISLAKGVSLLPDNQNPVATIVDPTVLAVLAKNIFETAGVFNLIYRERDLVYNLWHISGLFYRQRFEEIANHPENKVKAAVEKG